jgi:2-amino-4-hydroxy-6-hydroxymethyldihydropteridine diphosphokinase
MDRIFITDLRVKTIIGVYSWEQQTKQTISIDLIIGCNTQKAAINDDINLTIDYNETAQKVKKFAELTNFALIETLAEKIAKIVLDDDNINKVQVIVHKLDVVNNVRDVGVRIIRKKINKIFLSIGSNINPNENIAKTYKLLKNKFSNVKISQAYKNPAIGFTGDDFINSVVRIETNKSAKKVYKKIQKIEKKILENKKNKKFVARLIDIDMLTFNLEIVQNRKFKVPRLDITKYAHVLKPLSDIAPDDIHPTYGKTYQQLWQENIKFHNQQLQAVDIKL